jgi:hypothetical protein
MFDHIKSLFPAARALLHESEIIEAREKQANHYLATATDGKSLDDPAAQRKVASARSWLDLCRSRRGSLAREIRVATKELRRAHAPAAEQWNALIKGKKEQTWQDIYAATAPFFLGKKRHQENAIEHVPFPVINQIEEAFWIPLDGIQDLAVELALAESFISHVRHHACILKLEPPVIPAAAKTATP